MNIQVYGPLLWPMGMRSNIMKDIELLQRIADIIHCIVIIVYMMRYVGRTLHVSKLPSKFPRLWFFKEKIDSAMPEAPNVHKAMRLIHKKATK